MTQQLREIEGLALRLTRSDREELVSRLLSSLDDQPLNEVDDAWIEEAERRLQEMIDGTVKGIPGNRVIPEISREVGWESLSAS
jgi:putative addiction module component (TIGR02574 family)